MLKGFRDFVLRGNVVDLAVAVVVGAAFSAIVTALSTDVIGGLLSAVGGVPDFSQVSVDVNGAAHDGGVVVLGTLINAVVNFLIVSSVLYFAVVAPTNAVLARRRQHETPAPQAVSEDVALLREIRDLLRAEAHRGTGGPTGDGRA